jgi:EmrB/QacA subfamily drug resistance transporter
MSRRWLVFAVVSVGTFVAQLDLFVVNIAFPSIRAAFPGAPASSLTWVLDAYAIVFAACLVPAGRLTDLLGRRAGYQTGLALFALASIVCAAAPDLGVLVAGRVVQAVGAAVLVPCGLALLLGSFPAEQRASAVGAWSAVGAIAAASGPPLGGLLVTLSWRWVFLVNVPVVLVTLVAGVRVLEEIRHPDAGGLPDLPGAVVLVGAVGGLVLAIVEGESWGWGSARLLGTLAVSAVLLAVFVRRCLRHPLPVVEPELLRRRSFAAATVVMVLFAAGFGALLLCGVLFLTGMWAHGTIRAGLELMPGPVSVVGVALLTRRLVARLGARTVLAAGSLLLGVAAVWWRLRLGTGSNYWGAYFPATFVSGTGVGLTLPTLFATATGALPAHRFATGSAILNMARQIGFALGIAMLVAILGAGAPSLERFRDGYVAIALCAVASAIAAVVLVEPRAARRVSPAAPAEAA